MNAKKLTFLLLGMFIPFLAYSGEIPGILIICDAQTNEVVPSLHEQLKPEFRIESVLVTNWTEIQDQAKRLKKGKNILLFHTYIQVKPELIQRIASWKDIDVLWVKNSASGDDWPIPTIDLNGYLDKCKKEATIAQQAGFLAESIRQWWTACANTNLAIRRIRLWKGNPPAFKYESHEHVNALGRIDGISEPELVWFFPRKGKASTTVIFFPGGGYQYLGFLRNAKDLADRIDSLGIMVFGLKYRTDRNAEIPLIDAERAVRYVRAHAREWGIDPNRVGVAGQSAGANLVLNLAGNYDPGCPDSTDRVERESSRPDFMTVFNSWNFGSNKSTFTFYPDTPPVFFCHAEDDSAYQLAVEILFQLKAVNVPTESLILKTGGHGAFELLPTNPGFHWPSKFVRWLTQVKMFNP